jgi:exonuclease SbcC
MQVAQVHIKQLGRHAGLNCDMSAPVVGVLGENGAGKSTLLNAIRYAFTGDFGTTDADGKVKASTYMRDGGKHGTASVTMEFLKDGKKGTITRKITKTTSGRELVWDGRKITAAAEVDATMRDILNADKRSVMDCVFVKQGHLDDVLFGRQAEREKSFLRMAGCAHLDLVSKAAQTQAAILRADIHDHGPALQDLALQLEQKVSRFRELQQELDHQPDNSVLMSELAKRRAQLLTLEREEGASAAARQALAAMGDGPTLRRYLESEQQQHNSKIERLSQSLEISRAAIRQMQQMLSDAAAFQINLQSLTTAELAAKDLPPDSAELLEKLRGKYTELQAEVTFKSDLLKRLNAKACILADIHQASAQRDALLGQEAGILEALNKCTEDLEKLQANPEVPLWRLQVDILSKLGASTVHDLDACPVCQSRLDHWDAATAGKLVDGLRQKLAAYGAAEQEAALQLNQARLIERRFRASQTDLERVLLERQASLTALKDPQGDASEIEQQLRALQTQLTNLTAEGTHLGENQKRRQELLRNLQMAQGAFAHWRTREDFAQLNAFNAESARAEVQRLRSAESREFEEQQVSTTTLQNLALQLQQLNDAESRAAAAQQALVQARAVIGFTDTLSSVQAQIDTAQVAASQRASVLAALQEVQRDITSVQQRQGELENMQQLASLRLAKADQMSKLAEAFGREGISKIYLDSVYARLMLILSPHLGRMNANFTVRKGSGVLDFEFQRTDEPSEWMPQTQLSGGQRVKMAVAFLLALQEIVIPDVGLLVLDEPTTHLDSASREGFRDMLEDLQDVLQRKECQVIVCDHCNEILPALQKKVVLTV